jgi:hypothetical protein
MAQALKLSILPSAQRAVWPLLSEIPGGFVLFGGTALALRMGHRLSEDFDLFSVAGFVPGDLRNRCTLLRDARLLQSESNVLTVLDQRSEGQVKISLMGGLDFVSNAMPERDPDWPVPIASLDDLAGTKFKVLADRAEMKDYIDVHCLLQHGYTVNDFAAQATRLYGQIFNPWPSLKAMCYFDDGNLSELPAAMKKDLSHAATQYT